MGREMLRILLDDVIALLSPVNVVEISPEGPEQTSPHMNLLLVLGDLYDFLQEKKDPRKRSHAQLKLQFYAAQVASPPLFPMEAVRLVLGGLAMAQREYEDGI